MSISKRGGVPKWIKRGKGIRIPNHKRLSQEEESKQPMKFQHAEARKPRPAQNKGRGTQGGWAWIKGGRT